MGDLFFVIKMTVYTLILVILMQIKIGSTTLEQKVIEVTHHSQLAGYLQEVAQGAATFVGNQYTRLTGKIKKTPFVEKYSSGQKPGERLKHQWKSLQKSIRDKWKDHEATQTRKTEKSSLENQPPSPPEDQ